MSSLYQLKISISHTHMDFSLICCSLRPSLLSRPLTIIAFGCMSANSLLHTTSMSQQPPKSRAMDRVSLSLNYNET